MKKAYEEGESYVDNLCISQCAMRAHGTEYSCKKGKEHH